MWFVPMGRAVSVVLWIAWQGLSAALLCQDGLLLMFRHDVHRLSFEHGNMCAMVLHMLLESCVVW